MRSFSFPFGQFKLVAFNLIDLTERTGTSNKNMATIVRVKRRRDEDPLETLLLSNKKPKLTSATTERYNTDTDENVLKFAGTVHSKVA